MHGASSEEMAASSHNVELEAAKFLHKLIQDSTDEPAKLATKLYVVRVFSSVILLYLLYVSGFFGVCVAFRAFIRGCLWCNADTATHEVEWQGTFDAVSSDIEVEIYYLFTPFDCFSYLFDTGRFTG